MQSQLDVMALLGSVIAFGIWPRSRPLERGGVAEYPPE